jgi:hypothetical protein
MRGGVGRRHADALLDDGLTRAVQRVAVEAIGTGVGLGVGVADLALADRGQDGRVQAEHAARIRPVVDDDVDHVARVERLDEPAREGVHVVTAAQILPIGLRRAAVEQVEHGVEVRLDADRVEAPDAGARHGEAVDLLRAAAAAEAGHLAPAGEDLADERPVVRVGCDEGRVEILDRDDAAGVDRRGGRIGLRGGGVGVRKRRVGDDHRRIGRNHRCVGRNHRRVGHNDRSVGRNDGRVGGNDGRVRCNDRCVRIREGRIGRAADGLAAAAATTDGRTADGLAAAAAAPDRGTTRGGATRGGATRGGATRGRAAGAHVVRAGAGVTTAAAGREGRGDEGRVSESQRGHVNPSPSGALKCGRGVAP